MKGLCPKHISLILAGLAQWELTEEAVKMLLKCYFIPRDPGKDQRIQKDRAGNDAGGSGVEKSM